MIIGLVTRYTLNKKNMETLDERYYVGVVKEVVDPDLYQIKIDIPGVTIGALALPFRGEIDEPMPGNIVLVKSLDPVFGSVYLYSKLKENPFIGFRSRGKICTITEDNIKIGVFDPSTQYDDETVPEITSWITINSAGDVEIEAPGEMKVNVGADKTVTIAGSCNIIVSGSCKVESPDVTVTGGKLTVAGTAGATGQGGFCAIPVCPFSGAPHIGHIISGT